MPVVAVLNDESDHGEILGALKAYGLLAARALSAADESNEKGMCLYHEP